MPPIRHLRLLHPALLMLASAAAAGEAAPATADPFKDQGNPPPRALRLTPAEEAELLRDVTVDDGFEVTLFAPARMANYPVFVAASPEGLVFVSSDGNGAQGKSPHRGRVIRLRDVDGDGRADETTLFVPDLDSPRGLVWDHDRLYVMHPPDLSVFIDRDGDGVAEERTLLVKGLAFGFDKRAADHSTNGLTMGIDGWLYIAGGDFGFMDAVGSDGRHLQHRGGGVIRVRPDGSGLELFATGTRNILEVATSPLLDHFTRDNTNDGGGWDVRFHHLSGLEDHGYPRLYRQFADECIAPVADYGGGSGCGAVYIDEPGFGAWNDAPFTLDWGTGSLFRHAVRQSGASFAETGKPRSLIKVTKPTDADVDANGNIYLASWKGAVFNWAGPDVGYLVRVRPKGFVAEPLPAFATLDGPGLVRLLASPSHRRRLAAQRELVRRAAAGQGQAAALLALSGDRAQPLATRVAALAALDLSTPLPPEPPAARPAGDALGEYDARFAAGRGLAIDPAGVEAANPRHVLQALVAAARSRTLAAMLPVAEPWIARDARIAHVAARALALQADPAVCWPAVDRPGNAEVRASALRALAMMHQPAVIDGLVARLDATSDGAARRGLLSALCRLHFHEGGWKGDSWGTRPDTRGPYYQPEPWAGTPRVIAALEAVLAKAPPAELAFLVAEMNRNRIRSPEAQTRIIALAARDPAHLPAVAGQLGGAESIPPEAVPLLLQAARLADAAPPTYAAAVTALAKVDDAQGVAASLAAIDALARIPGSEREQNAARSALLAAPHLERHVAVLAEAIAAAGGTAQLGIELVLAISERKQADAAVRAQAADALAAAWKQPALRVRLLKAVANGRHGSYSAQVEKSLGDGDGEIAKAAKQAAERLGLGKQAPDATPKVGTLSTAEAIAQVVALKGDVALGEQVYARSGCVACHTTSQDQPLKGPFLGTIAKTYKRHELAEAILDPGRSVSQGFVTNLIALADGTQHMGFVTAESPERITIRTITAEEHTIATADIASRSRLPTSLMPPGLAAGMTVRELASLLDWLEKLAE